MPVVRSIFNPTSKGRAESKFYRWMTSGIWNGSDLEFLCSYLEAPSSQSWAGIRSLGGRDLISSWRQKRAPWMPFGLRACQVEQGV